MKKVLVLGAGMVAGPVVDHLFARDDLAVTVADVDGARAAALVSGSPRGKGLAVDARDLAAVGALLDDCDLLVSLLPPEYEPEVWRLAVTRRRSVVSASYREDPHSASPATDGLFEDARATGVTLMPEVGLDPGLDHMSISRMVAHVKARGGRVVACRSYCGGLPAPEANTNCWDYKFSWNPEGAVNATLLGARYLRDGREVSVPNTELFASHWLVTIPGFDELEAHFNGDALPYVGIYGVEGVGDLVRATLRYPGWSFTMRQIQKLAYNSTAPLDEAPATYAALTRRLAGVPEGGDLVAGLAAFLDVDVRSAVIERLVWLGLTAEEPVVWRAGQERTPLTALANRMFERMMYEEGERDLSVMHNEVEAEYPSGERERSTATLIAYGDPGGDSSMALTVGLTAAIAATLILDGRVADKGLVLPVKPHIFTPILDALAARGVVFDERTEKLPAAGSGVTAGQEVTP